MNSSFADEPEAPEKPQVMDWDEDHVDLAWVKPKSDGGSPIIEYIVQKKEKGSPYWANALTVPASQTAVSFLSFYVYIWITKTESCTLFAILISILF